MSEQTSNPTSGQNVPKSKFRRKSRQEQTAASKLRMERRGEKLDAAREKLAKQKPPKKPSAVKRLAHTAGHGVHGFVHGKLYEVEHEDSLVLSDGPAAEEYAYIPFPFSEDVPLSYEEQEALYGACEEFSMDYPLMLALIERETHFKNEIGDSGNSYGYCQIQPRWWSKTAESIGVTDLMDPEGNFRTGCAILTHLLGVYGCGNLTDALTAYNTGHGGASEYAGDVLEKQKKWQGVLGYE